MKIALEKTVRTKVILNLLYINIISIEKHCDQIQVYLTYRLDCLEVLILSEVNVYIETSPLVSSAVLKH